MSNPDNDTMEVKTTEPVTPALDPCQKAHDAEHDRFEDEDGACDDGVN